jgi:hypothetical protein
MQGEFDFDEKPAKGKTREQLQDDLKKYGITPRPGYDPKGPNLPDNVDPSTTREKYAAKAAENQEFKDKRVKPSPLVVEAELAKMKEITAPKSKGGGGGGGGGTGMPKTGLNKKPEYKSGGKVSSASKRADGCAIRGKTRA